MIASKYVFTFWLLLLVLASTSCQKSTSSSFLILAFDRLPHDLVNCSNDKDFENSGFQSICKESVQFTKAYTTSLQPAAAMASLLSGEYPYQHQLHRSFDRISHQTSLLSALALQNDYRTSFFSGSPHILRKTGLSRFFETFDDSAALNKKNVFKDFKIQSEEFLNWTAEESDKKFFSIIYNSELEIINTKDTNKTNFENLDDKLFVFFEELKKRNLWNTTHILLVGLNGQNKYSRFNETAFSNLHSENTQILALYKTARQKGDDGVNWKNDSETNLIGLNKIIQCFLKTCTDIEKKWDKKPLLVEAVNPYPNDENQIETKYALIDGTDLIIENEPPAMYNMLIDRFETNPLADEKEKTDKALSNFNDIRKNNIKRWVPGALNPRYLTNIHFYLNKNEQTDVLRNLTDPYNPLIVFSIEYYLKNWFQYQQVLEQKILPAMTLPKKNCKIEDRFEKETVRKCAEPLYKAYFNYVYSSEFELDPKKTEFEYLQLKEEHLNHIRRRAQNIALENIWGLEGPVATNYVEPIYFKDRSFFNR